MTQHNTQPTQRKPSGVDAILARNGGLSYLEIAAIDPRRSAVFYQKVLGWNLRDAETDHPKFSDQTGHLIGRWISGRAISREAGVLPYFYVDRIDDVASRAAAHGGEVVKAPYAEGNLRVSTVRDPAGNLIGLWEEAGG